MFELLLDLADGKRAGPGEVDKLRLELGRLEQTVSRATAQSQGGGSLAAKFDKIIVTGDVDLPAGSVNVGPFAKGKSNARLSAGGLQLRNFTTVKIDLRSDGDVRIGSDVAAPGTTYLSIFSNIETYNSEAVGAGDMLIGDNSTGKANILWQKSTGRMLFRGGPTTKLYIDTSGNLVHTNNTRLSWQATDGSSGAFVVMDSSDRFSLNNEETSKPISLYITLTDLTSLSLDWKEDPGLANRTQMVLATGTKGINFTMTDGGALPDTVIQTAGSAGGTTFATFPGAVNVGTGASTTAGELTVSGSATVLTGVNVGTATGAAAGEVSASLGLRSGSADLVQGYDNASLASGSSITLINIRGLVLVSNATDNVCQLVILRAGGTAIASVADSGLGMSLGADAGATLAVLFVGGAWTVKNKYAVAKNIRVHVIGN